MESLHTILLVVQVLVSVSLIGLVLIQHGKGADAGAAFGSGASSTVFGARGSANFLTRSTAILAVIFLINSLALAWIATQRVSVDTSLMAQPVSESMPVSEPVSPVINEIPAAPASDVPSLPDEAEGMAMPTTDVPELPADEMPAEPMSDMPVVTPEGSE